MERWSNRVALVTGASSGIGAGICKALVKSGMKVVGAARRVERIQTLANELKGEKGSLMAIKCDLTKDDDIYDLFKAIKDTYGGVDVCVNNAGAYTSEGLLDGQPDEWRRVVDVNIIALCLCTKLSVASMRERGVDDGQIINVSSLAAYHVRPKKVLYFYSGTKHAVRAITEGLRQELRQAKSHIRVSAISPGLVNTEMSVELQQTLRDEGIQLTIMQTEDVAKSVMHIISAPPHVEINDIILRPVEEL